MNKQVEVSGRQGCGTHRGDTSTTIIKTKPNEEASHKRG